MARSQARKRFGQHFLTDLSVVDAIIRALDPQPDDRVVEIGPGRGALTAPLLGHVRHLFAVELDRDLAARLRAAWPADRLTVCQADVLAVDFTDFLDGSAPLRLVGNLPYNISTPLLFHLMPWAAQVRDQYFMLQREVVDRMVAAPGSSQYGRLSVMLQARYRMVQLFDVPAQAFDPPPRVQSAVVRMQPRTGPAWRQARDPQVFEHLVATAFAQRRKMLRSSLHAWLPHLNLAALGIAPTARPQELTVDQFMDMADAQVDSGAPAPGAAGASDA